MGVVGIQQCGANTTVWSGSHTPHGKPNGGLSWGLAGGVLGAETENGPPPGRRRVIIPRNNPASIAWQVAPAGV
jgi:hypothetical protein